MLIAINIIIIITTTAMSIIFYTHNQYNYLISYSFKCYLLAEHLI